MTFNKIISATYLGEPKKGDKRVVERFLLIPKSVRGEWRWLCKVRISQIYLSDYEYSDYNKTWRNLEYIDDDKRQGQ
jgi:hypothetical protein